jgi:dTDP-glucose 4,6-dehydratase
MKKYLITGGAGFIGSHFVEMVLNQEKDALVYNLDKLTYAGKLENMPFLKDERHIFIQGDICDQNLISNLFKKYNFDVVVNFAAESHVDNSITDPSIFIQTNVFGVVNLLNNAREYWKEYSNHLFVQISTDEVYGTLAKTGYFDENSTIKPSSPYSSSKAAADLITYSYYKTYGLPILITRSSNNFGPRQDTEKLIPKVIFNLLNGLKIPLYGDGKNVRDWIFVRDNCEAIIKLIKSASIGEIYNIGGSNEKSNVEIVQILLSIFNVGEDVIQFVPDRLGHDFRYAIDDKKTISLIGHYRKHRFEEAVKETVEFYELLKQKKISNIADKS